MDAGTIFTTVSLMTFANGAVLAVVSRDLPPELRVAARDWQIGTMLVAAGCAALAFGAPLPRPIMLLVANGPMVFGLTFYYAAVQRFNGAHQRAWHWIPAIVATVVVVVFSTVVQDFRIRVIVVSLAWTWLMGASAWTLLRNSREDSSVSPKILAGLFALIMTCTFARLLAYLIMGAGPNFAIETGASWLNLLSPILGAILPVIGTTTFLLMCSDNLKRQLKAAAATDYLTGLPNRRTLAKYGTETFRTVKQRETGLFVAIFDIDKFKSINDRFGHEGGDQALVHVSGILRSDLRQEDMIARTGGEEFALVMPGVNHIEGIEHVEKIRLAIEQSRFSIEENEVAVTVSAGGATFRIDDAAFEDILRRADQALYKAKAGGRNRVEFAWFDYIPSLHNDAEKASHRRVHARKLENSEPQNRIGPLYR